MLLYYVSTRCVSRFQNPSDTMCLCTVSRIWYLLGFIKKMFLSLRERPSCCVIHDDNNYSNSSSSSASHPPTAWSSADFRTRMMMAVSFVPELIFFQIHYSFAFWSNCCHFHFFISRFDVLVQRHWWLRLPGISGGHGHLRLSQQRAGVHAPLHALRRVTSDNKRQVNYRSDVAGGGGGAAVKAGHIFSGSLLCDPRLMRRHYIITVLPTLVHWKVFM